MTKVDFNEYWHDVTQAFRRHARKQAWECINSCEEHNLHWRKRMELLEQMCPKYDAILESFGNLGRTMQ